MIKTIDFIESFSKSQNIYVDESIKSPITKKISTNQTIVNQKRVKEEIINKVNKNDQFNKKSTSTKQKKQGVYK